MFKKKFGLGKKKNSATKIKSVSSSTNSENNQSQKKGQKSRKRKSEDALSLRSSLTESGMISNDQSNGEMNDSKRPKIGKFASFRQLRRRASQFIVHAINSSAPSSNHLHSSGRRQSLGGAGSGNIGIASSAASTASMAAEPLLPPPLSGRFWGVPLDVMLNLDAEQLVSMSEAERKECSLGTAATAGMPHVFYLCLEWLHSNALDESRGSQSHGLFRISSDMKIQRQFRNYLEQRPDELEASISECTDQHLIANTLKSLLAELPGGLLTEELLPRLAADPENVNSIREVVHELPAVNHNVLFDMCYFLWKFAELESLHQMSVDNLARIFAPNLEGVNKASYLQRREDEQAALSTTTTTNSRTGSSSSSAKATSSSKRSPSRRRKSMHNNRNHLNKSNGRSELERMSLLTKLTSVTQQMIEFFPVIFGVSNEEEEEGDDEGKEKEEEEKVEEEEAAAAAVNDVAAKKKMRKKKSIAKIVPAKKIQCTSSPSSSSSSSKDNKSENISGSSGSGGIRSAISEDLSITLRAAEMATLKSWSSLTSSRKKRKLAESIVHLSVLKPSGKHSIALSGMMSAKKLRAQASWDVEQEPVPVNAFLPVARAAHSIIADGETAIVQKQLLALNDEQLTELICDPSQPEMLQTPVLIQNKTIFVGFSRILWQSKVKATP